MKAIAQTCISWMSGFLNRPFEEDDLVALAEALELTHGNEFRSFTEEQTVVALYSYAMEVKATLTEEFGETFPEDHPKLGHLLDLTENIIRCNAKGARASAREIVNQYEDAHKHLRGYYSRTDLLAIVKKARGGNSL